MPSTYAKDLIMLFYVKSENVFRWLIFGGKIQNLPNGAANPTVRVWGNFANMTKMRTLIVPIRNNRKRINQLKTTSSAITTVTSNITEKNSKNFFSWNQNIIKKTISKNSWKSPTNIKDEKNSFRTNLGFSFEIGTPLISWKKIYALLGLLNPISRKKLLTFFYHLRRMISIH